MQMKVKYWPEQSQKFWYAFVVDGRCIGIVQESAKAEKEKKRLENLCGIQVRKATPNELIKFNAKTAIPTRIVKIMQAKARTRSPRTVVSRPKSVN